MPAFEYRHWLVIPWLLLLAVPVQAEEFGKTELHVGESDIKLYARLDEYIIGEKAMIDWVKQSARAVAVYYGRFPVRKLTIVLEGYDGSGVRSGRAYGYPALQVIIGVGYHVSKEQLRDDWILVHELIHLAMAELPDRHHWLEEGLPTYIESIARVQAGDLTDEMIWKGFMKGMPNGLPGVGDKGLDHTPTWGRTYWGGALFCLLVDIEIRKQTRMKMGLQQAMQAVMEGGLTLDKDASMEDVLRLADEATGTEIMRKFYNAMKADPGSVDLDSLWEQLGISLDEQGNVILDNTAPLAAIRIAITHPAVK